MPPIQYVTLLRGINVGGKNMIPMAELKRSFDALGLEDVSTYIQSGNVLFRTSKARRNLVRAIEDMLSEDFRLKIPVVLRSHDELAKVVADAPDGFGGDRERYRYDVLFLKEPLTAREAIVDVPTKEGVDEVSPGDGVLYFSRLTSRASQSRLSRITGLAVYQHMTIRNWNTTTKLLALLDDRASAR